MVLPPATMPQMRRIRTELQIQFPKIFKPLDEAHRYKILYGGRASAKSWTVARKLLLRGTKQKLLILCTRELQKSIKDSVHRLLKNQIDLMGLTKFYDVQKDKIVGANGTEFIFLGIRHNIDEIKSTEGVDICWIEEAHNMTETSWDIIEPTIRKEGSEIWVVYNTRFKFDVIHQTFVKHEPPPDSLVIFANYWDNPFLTDTTMRSIEHMKETNYEKYLWVYCGEEKRLAEGAIFGKQVTDVEKAGRRTFIPVEKNVECFSFMDLGKNDETAIWIMQRAGMQNRMIDYFEGRLEEIEYYVRFLRHMPYLYGNHYMPHDAAHNRLGMTKTIEEQFNDGGIRPTVIVDRIQEKSQAIQLARDVFAKTWFHKGDDLGKPVQECEGYYSQTENEDMMTRTRRCERGWEVLCNYRYKYKEEDDVFHQSPHHDWASNGADAFMQYGQSDFNGIAAPHDDWDEPINE